MFSEKFMVSLDFKLPIQENQESQNLIHVKFFLQNKIRSTV